MKIDEIMALGAEKALLYLTKDRGGDEVDSWREQYEGDHKILRKPDKDIGSGESKKTIVLSKLVTTFQKVIVERCIGFLFGEAPVITRVSDDTTQEAFERLRQTLKKCKVETLNRQIARDLFIETRAAELWYAVKADQKAPAKIGVMRLSVETGNRITAHFDDSGDMDAFVREFERDVINDTGAIVAEAVAEIYTADKVFVMRKSGGPWVVEEKLNPFKKIPVVYYEQPAPEWGDVQSLIDRLEELLSSHADTNDYYASPTVKVKGDVESLPDKAQTGKLLKFKGVKDANGKTDYGDAEYLTWDQSPESIKLEINNLKSLIYSLTSTPDISFDNVKGIGAVSGIALKLLFLDAILKAKNKEEIFGAALARRTNVLKAILSVVDVTMVDALSRLEVGVKFMSALPEDTAELVTMLSSARGGEPLISAETAVKNIPFVEDADAEISRLSKEKPTMSIAESFIP